MEEPEQLTAPETEQPAEPVPSPLKEVLGAEPSMPPQPSTRQKTRTRDAFFGLVLVLLSGVGVWALAQKGTAMAAKMRAGESYEGELRACILPLAVMDCPDFDSPDALSDEEFLTLSVWAAVTDGKLEGEGENALCTIGTDELIAAGNARLGTNRRPEYKTIAFTNEVRFYFDSTQQAYMVPKAPAYYSVSPEIREFSADENGIYHVTADYRRDLPAWYPGTAEITKTAEFSLRQTEDSWEIVSLHTVG